MILSHRRAEATRNQVRRSPPRLVDQRNLRDHRYLEATVQRRHRQVSHGNVQTCQDVKSVGVRAAQPRRRAAGRVAQDRSTRGLGKKITEGLVTV
jgi:hypothetical protein